MAAGQDVRMPSSFRTNKLEANRNANDQKIHRLQMLLNKVLGRQSSDSLV
jgi:hypothetical protein